MREQNKKAVMHRIAALSRHIKEHAELMEKHPFPISVGEDLALLRRLIAALEVNINTLNDMEKDESET